MRQLQNKSRISSTDQVALDDVDDSGLLVMWKIEHRSDESPNTRLVKVPDELCGHVSPYQSYLFLYGYECSKVCCGTSHL